MEVLEDYTEGERQKQHRMEEVLGDVNERMVSS
jgi:hypothetical protein